MTDGARDGSAEVHEHTPIETVRRIAEVAHAVGFQAGVPAMEIAGMIVSFLAAHPEHVARFIAEGSELFVDGTITSEGGCLSFRAISGSIGSPEQLRKLKGIQQ